MTREPLYMKVSIGGDVVRRQAEPVHLRDNAGRIVATCMRPGLRDGEMLIERIGAIPEIIMEPA